MSTIFKFQYLQTATTRDPELPYQVVRKNYKQGEHSALLGRVEVVPTGEYFSTAEKADKKGLSLSEQFLLPHISERATAVVSIPFPTTIACFKISPENALSQDAVFSIEDPRTRLANIFVASLYTGQFVDRDKELHIFNSQIYASCPRDTFKILAAQVTT